jgi:hypothetical protein
MNERQDMTGDPRNAPDRRFGAQEARVRTGAKVTHIDRFCILKAVLACRTERVKEERLAALSGCQREGPIWVW